MVSQKGMPFLVDNQELTQKVSLPDKYGKICPEILSHPFQIIIHPPPIISPYKSIEVFNKVDAIPSKYNKFSKSNVHLNPGS